MSSPKRRIETDVMKLMMSDYEVTLVNDNMQEFYVIFKGPTESKRVSLVSYWSLQCNVTGRRADMGYFQQHPLRTANGKFTSSYPTPIPTDRPQSVSSTGSSTLTSMKRQSSIFSNSIYCLRVWGDR